MQQIHNRCLHCVKKKLYLQTDGTGKTWETTGALISLLPKHTLLTSRSGLSVTSLHKKKHSDK